MNVVKYEKCTVTQAADWLGVSRETIYNWVKSGRLNYAVNQNGDKAKYFLATDLDHIRHERIVEAGERLMELQAIPGLG